MMISKPHLLAFSLTIICPLSSAAAEDWLVISHATMLKAGEKLPLEVIKPDSAAWPQTLTLKLNGAGVSEEVVLLSAAPDEQSLTNRRSFVLVSNKKYAGVVKASLADLHSNPFLLLAAATADAAQNPAVIGQLAESEQAVEPFVEQEAVEPDGYLSPRIMIAKPGDEPPLSAHEPTYFIIGNSSDRDTDARFQLSFKYRLFDPEGIFGKFSPLLSNLYFTYTQTSLWDLGEDSSPFRDTSYRPGLFYKWQGSDQFLLPDEWRTGVEHESNGQSFEDSRSIDTAYINPIWHINMENSRRFSFMPKIYHYIDKHENRDIQRYRGYVDWLARYGREDGLILNGLYRQGTSGYASGQLDVSYPISARIFARTGSFVHLQLFSGYGETLLDYDQDRDTQIRLGISIAR